MKIKKVLIPFAAMSLVGTLALTSCNANENNNTTQSTEPVVEVKEYAPNELSVNEINATTVFNLGEKFSYDGLRVTVVYSNYTTRVLADNEYVVDSSSFDSSKAGTYDIHVVYTSEKNVRVTKSYQVTVKSIAEEATPHVLGIEASIEKTSYNVNEAFSSKGLKVTAYYSDGTSKDVTNESQTDESLINNSQMGVSQYKVTYKEKYTKDGKEETKECKTFILITFDAVLGRVEFVSGTTTVEQDTVGPDGTMSSLDISDWVIKGTFYDKDYNSFDTNIDSSKVTVSNFNAGAAGDQKVTISYRHGNVTKTCTTIVHVTAIADPDYQFNAGTLPQANNTSLTEETVIDDVLSAGMKCQIKDESTPKVYGTLSFAKRIQTNGAGKAENANYIKFTLTSDATVAIIGRASDASKPVTAAGFYDVNNSLVSTSYAYSIDISKYKYELKAGTYYFYDPGYAVQIYGIQIWYK